MDILHLIILAVVQGVTEFLPVSSSAHILLTAHLLSEAHDPLFITIMLHGATTAALIVSFLKDIRSLAVGVFHRQEDRLYVATLALATIPVGIAGVFLYQVFNHFNNPVTIACALIVSGILLFTADRIGHLVRKDALPHLVKGVLVGVVQVLAIAPGISRSGITMTAGRLVGFSRREAVRFSFLLAIPVLLGAFLYSLMSVNFSAEGIPVSLPVLITAMVCSFLIASMVIRWLLRTIERIGFTPFCIYQVALGIGILATV